MRVISAWVDDSWAESLDSAARERGLNRSQLIVLALQELLGITPAQRKRDGIEAAAMQIVRANPSSSLREIVRKLREAGIDRGKSWVHKKRQELSAEL